MNKARREKLLNFTKKFKKHPLNISFYSDNNLAKYQALIKKPMDFTKIQQNLEENIYKNSVEWYNDMELIYTNAILYNQDNEIALIAKYLLSQFKKEAYGYNKKDINEWNEGYQKLLSKLGDFISNSPVPQGSDDITSSCIKRSHRMPQMSISEISKMKDHMENYLDRDDFRSNLISIIRHTQKDVLPSSHEQHGSNKSITIDLEKLNHQALNALNLLVQSYELISQDSDNDN